MKTPFLPVQGLGRVFCSGLLFALCLGAAGRADAGGGNDSAIAVGGRFHTKHSTFTTLPYNDGDFSYSAAYELHNDAAYWQLAVNYCPNPSRTNTINDAVTPQLNLLFKDGMWRGGLGALATYEQDETLNKREWSDVYYQFLLGVGMGERTLGLDVLAVYPFESFDALSDFDTKDVEVQAWLKYRF